MMKKYSLQIEQTVVISTVVKAETMEEAVKQGHELAAQDFVGLKTAKGWSRDYEGEQRLIGTYEWESR